MGRVEWVQANAPLRARNMVNRELVPLHKERSGGDHPVGALPPADVPFPGTDQELAALTNPQLHALSSFYREDFGGTVAERRMAFARFVTGKN